MSFTRQFASGLSLVVISSAHAETVIHVDDDNCPGPGSGTEADPYCSIQTAIDAAVDTDEIVVAPGTYFETINFLGKAITLRSEDGAGVTIIDGTDFFHVVQCVSGEGPDTVLDGFTITGGDADGSCPDDCRGGGMFNDSSSPTVANCTFSGNAASFLGGGVFNHSGSPQLVNCLFSANETPLAGGGMYNLQSSPMLTNCTFSNNTSSQGGGMYNVGDPTVTNCTFSGNTANFGGGIFNSESRPTMINCTFIGNWAQTGGGGILNLSGSTPTVTNCTFSGNVASDGGGMYNFENSTPTATNCILWNNGPDQIFGPATVAYSDVESGFPGPGNIDADPLFVDSLSGNLRLSPDSPCIDAGDNSAVPEDITTDLDGNPRFMDDRDTPDTGNGTPPIVDMGAYEYQLPCPWDCDGSDDGNVNVSDLLALLGQYDSQAPNNCTGGPCDYNGDGCVDVTDLLKLLSHYDPAGVGCP